MAGITINTDGLRGVANSIDQLNKNMSQEGESLTGKVNTLSQSWKSEAGSKIIAQFDEIRTKFFENRNIVMNDYVRFLYEQVGESYDTTETTNTNLARAFK